MVNKITEKMAQIKQAADYLESVSNSPLVAIICGSGLGGLASTITSPIEVPFESIPNFKKITVSGHSGRLVFGKISDVSVVCMVGRFHFYEGYSMDEITFPVRVFNALGVKILLVTNASGSLNPAYKVGDVMILKDHINLVGMTGINPLIGPNLDIGPRFVAMTEAYDRELRNLLKLSYAEVVGGAAEEGVYVCIAGPNYESKAEAKFLRIIGGDAVGMSTVPEVLVAKHSGMLVAGFALITNKVIMSEDDTISPPNHEEVLIASKNREKALEALVQTFMKKLNSKYIKQ